MFAPTALKPVFVRLVLTLVASLVFMPTPAIAQTSTSTVPPQPPAWQVAAGGKMEFEVASIHLGDPSKFTPPTFDLNIGDEPIPPDGRFKADFPLPTYIMFAHKLLLTAEQEQAMVAHLPKWVGTEWFAIDAKAEGSPTKDQMRLMMQSLLADRFKLAVHFETQDHPALALVLSRPGVLGSRLRPHEQGLACDAKWTAPPDPAAPTVPPGEFLRVCGAVSEIINGTSHSILLGARNVTLQAIAAYLAMVPAVTDFGRPVVDQTGLLGMYDFSLNWLPDRSVNSAIPGEPLDAQAPFDDALKEQLGLKLKPTRAEVQTLVIDHVEQPSPN